MNAIRNETLSQDIDGRCCQAELAENLRNVFHVPDKEALSKVLRNEDAVPWFNGQSANATVECRISVAADHRTVGSDDKDVAFVSIFRGTPCLTEIVASSLLPVVQKRSLVINDSDDLNGCRLVGNK